MPDGFSCATGESSSESPWSSKDQEVNCSQGTPVCFAPAQTGGCHKNGKHAMKKESELVENFPAQHIFLMESVT